MHGRQNRGVKRHFLSGPPGYSVYPFRDEDSRPNEHRYPGLPAYGDSLIIGCADNAAARRAMAECLPGDPRRWLIAAGNDTNWGQVLVGNVPERVTLDEPPFTGETCYLVPAPTLQRPDLLTAVSARPPDVDCTAALDFTDQDPIINQMMASLALQVVRRMVADHLPLHGPLPGHGAGHGHPDLRHPGGGGAGYERRLLMIGAHEHSQRRNKRGETMSDEKGTTTTWQDNHSGLRRHKLMMKEIGEKIPALYANENVEDYDAVLAPAKLFSPYTGWTWYITEWQAETGLRFGLVEGFETELGYFDLTELAEATVFGRVPAVERDLYWEPMTLGEIRGQSREGIAA